MARKITKPSGKIVSRTDLADVFGVSMPTVDTWVRQGCPVVKRGSKGISWEFATADVAEWLRERAAAELTGDGNNLDEIERRTKMAKMIVAELEVAEAKKQVALVSEFERAQSMFAAAIQASVMQVTQRVVIRLLGETDEATFKKVLNGELAAALRQAAEAEVDLPPEALEEIGGDDAE